MTPHAHHAPPGTSVRVVAGSLLVGGASAVALAAAPFAGGGEATITGAILLGFAIGWALLALLSTRRDASYRWAAVPAAALGLSGTVLLTLAPSSRTLDSLAWVWPPLLLALVVWMTAQTRRHASGRRSRWTLYPVLAVMTLSAVGCGYEALHSGSRDGHRLDLRCSGSGSPVVVLEPGLGGSASAIARWIAPEVARTTRVCVHDRAGHGRGDIAPDADPARDLHVLLERAHVPGPYVLAGHSLGGVFALGYAQRYPSQVGGVVLLDSMHPRQSHTAAGGLGPLLDVVPAVARTGLARLFFDPEDGDPTAQARQFVRDLEQMPAQLDRAAQLTTLGDRPLGVVTAGTGSQPGWREHQNDLATLSQRSFHRTVAGSTHQSLIDDPRHAAASGRAIRDVVDAVRDGEGS